MSNEENPPLNQHIKRKINYTESEFDSNQTNAIKHPNHSISPILTTSKHIPMHSLTIDDLEELKIQLLGLIHCPKWEYNIDAFNAIIKCFQSMNYDLNYSYQPYTKPYTIYLQYPWQSKSEKAFLSVTSNSNISLPIDTTITQIIDLTAEKRTENGYIYKNGTAPEQKSHSNGIEISRNNFVSNTIISPVLLNTRLLCILPLSPLHYAAYLGAEELIIPLLQSGAIKDLKVLNYNNYEFANKTAAEIALQRGYHRIFHIIEEYEDKIVYENMIPNMTDMNMLDTNAIDIHTIDSSQSNEGENSVAQNNTDQSNVKVLDTKVLDTKVLDTKVLDASDVLLNSTLENNFFESSLLLPKPRLNRVSSNEIFLIPSLNPSRNTSKTNLAMISEQSSGTESGNTDMITTNHPMFTETMFRNTLLGNRQSISRKRKYGIGSHAGYKNPSEDRIIVLEIDSYTSLYMIFDGHGGSHYAEEASKLLPNNIKDRINLMMNPTEKDMETILIEEIILLDDKLVKLGDEIFQYTKGGSTLVAAIVTQSHIIVANVGDSPAIVFDSFGTLLRQSDDHNPDNSSEYERIMKLGANIVLSNEFGDLRVQSGRGQLTVTRALGQYEFKRSANNGVRSSNDLLLSPDSHVHKQIVTCYPQTYIWPTTSFVPPAMSNFGNDKKLGNNLLKENRCYMALYSDSFTEALRDHRSGRIVASTGRPEQVIGNFLTNKEALEFIFYELKKYDYDVEVAAQDIAEKQVHKFYMYNSYFGDNTSIILVDLGVNIVDSALPSALPSTLPSTLASPTGEYSLLSCDEGAEKEPKGSPILDRSSLSLSQSLSQSPSDPSPNLGDKNNSSSGREDLDFTNPDLLF